MKFDINVGSIFILLSKWKDIYKIPYKILTESLQLLSWKRKEKQESKNEDKDEGSSRLDER